MPGPQRAWPKNLGCLLGLAIGLVFDLRKAVAPTIEGLNRNPRLVFDWLGLGRSTQPRTKSAALPPETSSPMDQYEGACPATPGWPSDVTEVPQNGKEAGLSGTSSPQHAKPCRISLTTRQETMSMPERDNAPRGVRGLHGRAWGLRWMREAIEERPCTRSCR